MSRALPAALIAFLAPVPAHVDPASTAGSGPVVSAPVLPDAAADAQTAFEKAEARVRAGRYDEARTEYKRIATKWPETPAGIEAARRARPSAFLGWTDVVRNGPSKNRIDVVLMGDGYELEHLNAFADLSKDVPPLFARQPTFREYASYFNFVRADVLSAESGVDGFGREYDTALGGHTLDTFAGHVGIDRGLVMDVLARIPDTDGLAIVFVKNGVLGTGGGGIATIGGREVKTIIHEFGHSFGGLTDEYATKTGHGSRARAGAINAAVTDDPKQVPWAHWIAAKHPSVGVYEGAMGQARGAWRPTATGCVMDSDERFCVVCQEALVLAIYSIVDPIEAVEPPSTPLEQRECLRVGDEPLVLVTTVTKPATHALEVTWWVLPEARFPKSAAPAPSRETRPSRLADLLDDWSGRRSARGKLAPIAEEPAAVARNNTSGVHKFTLSKKDLAPGRYRVVCRARDTTLLRGEKFPWVLKDDDGLLESERGWWIEVPADK